MIAILLLHPEVRRKVQDELDRVLGGKRLPDFDDRESLPYLEAVIQEAMRWHPPGQLGELEFSLWPCRNNNNWIMVRARLAA